MNIHFAKFSNYNRGLVADCTKLRGILRYGYVCRIIIICA